MEEEKARQDKFEQLYKMAERKKGKKDLDRDEIELSKNPDEYTFQPNAHKRKGGRKNKSPEPAEEKEYVNPNQRISKGLIPSPRTKSEPPKLRGGQKRVTEKQKEEEQKKEEEESEEERFEGDPLLYVDVNFGTEEKTRIALYEKSNPVKVAKRFVKEHGLDSTIMDNLVALLKE